MKRILLLLVSLLNIHFGIAQSSVLSEGTWYKVGITQTGLYKIDRNTLDVLGVSGSVNPQKIKIYGNGAKGMLPQLNSESRPIDLVENAIYISGEADGSFDSNDYILFYGLGPHKEVWTAEGFEYERNIYSDTSFYFIRVDGANGRRIAKKASEGGSASSIVTSFDDHIVHEEDEKNLISSGREWFGPTLNSGDSESYSHQISGLNSSINLTLDVVSQSSENAVFNISAGSNVVGSVSIDAVPDGPGTTYSLKARQVTDTFLLPQAQSFDLRIEFNGNASGERGYIDFYSMTFLRELRLHGNETDFRYSKNTGELLQYEVAGGASNTTIWDVTDPTDIKEQQFSVSGNKAVFKSQSNQIEEFLVFEGSDYPTPFIFGAVSNQDLRGNTALDGIIVTHPSFRTEAEQLAQFHREHDGLNVQVATTREVFNEFSSGRQDVAAIRDYARFVFQNGGRLKYLLLFGDCSYDYKDRITNNTNFVLTYESRESFHPIFSYSSDDYFGFFEDDEGEWIESTSGDHTLEIGIGRLPAKTQEEAKTMVDKIIYYSTSPSTLGKWRGEMTYVGDDGDGNVHARHVEDLSELIDTTYAQYNINKVLLDAFVQEASGSSEKSPQASSALKTRIKNGTFLVNFIGHGNERLWMEEEILTKADIEELTNRNKLPIFVTATCEFGRYDDPIGVSGAEELLLLKQGGGIALLTTSRPVFASTNFSLNQAFHENIFRKESGQNLRLGDVIRLTKNEGLEGPVNRNFTLLGDPMMMPSFPKMDIVVNKVGNSLDTLSALEEVTFAGEIQSGGVLQPSFNGRLIVGIYDVKQSFKTIGQESTPYTYQLRTNALFRGEATVREGKFSVTFVVPKNISYQYQKGKMSFYAWDEKSNVDAGGSSRDFVIGGTSTNPSFDNEAPIVSAYLNDPSFKNGSIVGDSPLLIAKIEDESGVTTTRAGVVQGITLKLGGETINLNDFYTADPDEFQKGTITYPMQDLAPGKYQATLGVWDTHNNLAETTVEFEVTDKPILFVYNSLAYPNPVTDATTFSFEHDREDEDLYVSLLVYGTKGEVVSKQNMIFENSERIVEIPWKAQTNTGEALRQGIYYSRLIIQSGLDGAMKEITQKLVIVN